MNDPKLTVKNIEDIIAATKGDLSYAERAGLFAAISTIGKNVEEHIDDSMDGDGYAHEKITQVVWHVGAALGFDITNGHSAEQHRSWAYGACSTLENLLTATAD